MKLRFIIMDMFLNLIHELTKNLIKYKKSVHFLKLLVEEKIYRKKCYNLNLK